MSRTTRPNIRALALAVVGGLAIALLPQAPAFGATVSEVEPNNTTAQAQTVALGDTVNAKFATSGNCDNNFYDCDIYRINAGSAGRLTIDIRFSNALGTENSFELKVLDSAGVTTYTHHVASSDYDGSRLRALAIHVGAGISYISLKTRVSGFSSNYIWAGQSYTFRPTLETKSVETEKNGSTATADVLSVDQTVEGSAFQADCDNNFYDCDYYRLTVASAAVLGIDFRFPCDLGSGNTYLVTASDNAGKTLASKQLTGADCSGGTLRNIVLTPPSGNFYVMVKSRAGTVTYGKPYTLKVVGLRFVDVNANNQFLSEIAWMSTAGVSTGYEIGGGRREYRPAASVTRDAMAAFLYRAAGSPSYTPPASSPFVDVTPSSQFYKEITWLASRGISTGWDVGKGKKEFRPLAPIARDAMAAFLYRYKNSPSYTPPATSLFLDVPKAHQFYKEISWMSSKGISTGYDVVGGKEYRPLNAVARDAMAAFLYRAK